MPDAATIHPARDAAPRPGRALRIALPPGLGRLLARVNSLRVKTALVFGGLTVLVCGALALALGAMLTAEIRLDSARSLNVVADTAARTLAAGLTQRLLETEVIADSADLWADGLASNAVARALARSQAAQPHSAWIGVADAEGKVQSAIGGMLVGQSVAQRPWFVAGMRAPHVGDVHRAKLLESMLPKPADGEPVRFVDFAAPIRVNGKTVGVLGVHGSWDWSRDVVSSLMAVDAHERGLEVYIFDRGGQVLYAPNRPLAGAPPLAIDQLGPQLAQRTEGRSAEVVTWPDGAAYLTALVPLPARSAATDMGWQIVAREPVNRAFARARTVSRQAFGVGIVIAALAAALAWFASGRLTRPLTTIARAARDVQNRVPGAAIRVQHDNAEVRTLSTALAGMASRLDATYQTAPVGMCQIDADGRVLSSNRLLADILGIPSELLLRHRLGELIVETDRDRFADDLRRLAAGRIQTLFRELSFLRQGDKPLLVALSASTAPSLDGEAPYFIVVVEDVSQRKAAEAADRANATKTAFLSQVSHELRTPLNAVLGFSQLMELDAKEPLSPKQRQRVTAISGAGRHLLAMIEDLLHLTQIESDRMLLSPEPVAISVVLDESTALVAEAASRAQVRLIVVPPPTEVLGWVRADHVRMRQVLVNLLSNAIKYNRAGGDVTVAWGASADAERIELRVSDTGRGIPADRMEHLFEPFNRLGNESSGIQGTGIGLVITRKLVTMMDGEIRVDSEAGVGSRFTITMPRAAPKPLLALPPTRCTVPAALDVAMARRTVMYVEDNELNALLVSAAIEMRPDYRLVVARSGEEALKLATLSPPDVFLLDMHLGDMTGLELAARIDRLPIFDGTPFIALSADAAPAAIAESAEAGFAAYLTKPLDLRRLLVCLDGLLRPPAEAVVEDRQRAG